MDQYIGKMLDNRYEILECIGIGGMAVVYKARCHRLNRLVAIKVLKPELANDAEFKRRFQDESRAVAMLSHANIVGVYDVSRSDELDYIVMELIDGLTLKQYMNKRGAPLNWREALHFVTQIVRALGHAHSRGIIHRDIKPQNILVLRDGSAKVTDFGIARVASAAHTTLTQEALGSVHYISPEQAKGSHIDGRSDLYSAGVVLYEMLTGRLPFEGESPVSVAIQHINSIPIPPRDLNPNIPPVLEEITMKAMAPRRENRYASADEMLADLEEFRKNPDRSAAEPIKRTENEVDEPTRVVPVSEIKQETERSTKQEYPEKRPRKRKQKTVAAENEYDEEDNEVQKRGVSPFLIAVLAILVFVAAMIFFVYNFVFKGILSQPKEYTVPDITFYTIEQMEKNPDLAAPFTVIVDKTVYSADHALGEIIDQIPQEGTTVREGGNMVIRVTVSEGEETIVFDTLINKFSSSATTELNALGLIPDVEYEYNEDVESDYVIRTIPAAGTKLSRGDTVTVVVSLGKQKEMVKVINFINMDSIQAQEAAEMSGLTVGEVKEYYNDDYEAGKVMFQSLGVDSNVERGTVIYFQVSLGPEVVPSEAPNSSEPPEGGPSNDPENTPAIATPQTLNVDLSGQTGLVYVKVVVGGTVYHEGLVDAMSMPEPYLPVHVTGTGTQEAMIYLNGILVDRYDVEFGT